MKNAHRVTDTEGLTNALNRTLCKIEEQTTGNTAVLRFAARHAADACNLFERRLIACRDCELNELDPWDGTVTLYSTDVDTIQRALDVTSDRLTCYAKRIDR